MSMIGGFIGRIKARRAAKQAAASQVGGPLLPPGVIVISTPFGPVSEVARRQAEVNMAADPSLRAKVEAAVIRECGGDSRKGMAEARRRYPMAYANESGVANAAQGH
jgi:hypothetical protein